MPKIFCGKCEHYQGTEKVPNPKSTAWMDASRPKCEFGLGKTASEADYRCTHYEPNEITRARDEKFAKEMKQLQLLGSEYA